MKTHNQKVQLTSKDNDFQCNLLGTRHKKRIGYVIDRLNKRKCSCNFNKHHHIFFFSSLLLRYFSFVVQAFSQDHLTPPPNSLEESLLSKITKHYSQPVRNIGANTKEQKGANPFKRRIKFRKKEERR